MALCAYLKKQNAYCDVMSPESFARIAASVAAEAKDNPPPNAVAQGSDDPPPKKKSTKRKK